MSTVRHAIVTICWGPLAGAKTAIAPGQTLTVGRGEAAGLRVADDGALAPLHFELRWDGRRGELRHLAGPHLTLLGGQALEAGPVAHGQWIRAGETDFMVHFEAETPPASPREPSAANAAERALVELRGGPGQLYAVLDLARDPRIGELLRESVEPCGSLFDGIEGSRLAEVAPHVVQMSRGSRLCGDLVREGWGLRWGMWLVSERPLLELRRHLRKFLLVQLEGSNAPTYFRFYDPDVLRVYLTSCTASERSQWFGGIVTEYLGEDPGAPEGWWCALAQG